MRLGSPTILAFLLCLAPFVHAQTIDWAEVHKLTMRGIDQLYNLEIDQADTTFDAVIRMAPSDPRGHFFKSMVHFWLYTLNREQKEFDAFMEKSDRVIEVCDDLLDHDERDANAHFYLGGMYGYRGMAQQTNGSMLKAVIDGKRGFSHLEYAVKKDPGLYDAQMGFGLFRYLLAKVPRGLGWILKIAGFSGDLEGGLQSLKLAADKGVYTRSEASYYLSQFLFSEHRRDEAFSYLNALIKKYPENTLLLLSYATWQARFNNDDEALAAASKAVAINSRKTMKYGEELAYSTLGGLYFSRNDFPAARTNYEIYLQRVQNKTVAPNWTWYRMGISRELTGDRAGAIECYGKMRKVSAAERPGDAYNYRMAQQFLSRPISVAEALLIKASNELGRKNYTPASALYDDALNHAGDNVDIQARALYGIQQLHFEREQYPEAIAISNRLLSLQPEQERWLIPHGYFRLGQIYAKLGQTADARKAFEQVGKFDDYDFQTGLEGRVEEELKKLAAPG
jgi:tetratricopeptide (TPR) repeat protein